LAAAQVLRGLKVRLKAIWIVNTLSFVLAGSIINESKRAELVDRRLGVEKGIGVEFMSMDVEFNQEEIGQLKESAKKFVERQKLNSLLNTRVSHCLKVIEKICRKISEIAGPDVVDCRAEEDVLIVSAYDRNLTISPAPGAASDARLARPRGLYCSQILVFAHLSGQKDSALLEAFRIYPDGSCSDGEDTWKAQEDCPGFIRYINDLIRRHLLDCDMYWPALEDLPGFVRSIPVHDNRLDQERLKRTCIGFECSLSNTPVKDHNDHPNS
jgi:hypothetical protein